MLKEVLGVEDFSCFKALFVVVKEVFVKVELDLVSRGSYQVPNSVYNTVSVSREVGSFSKEKCLGYSYKQVKFRGVSFKEFQAFRLNSQ